MRLHDQTGNYSGALLAAKEMAKASDSEYQEISLRCQAYYEGVLNLKPLEEYPEDFQRIYNLIMSDILTNLDPIKVIESYELHDDEKKVVTLLVALVLKDQDRTLDAQRMVDYYYSISNPMQRK